MKRIKFRYNLPAEAENGTIIDQFFDKSLPWSEKAIRIAEEESFDGTYTEEDDGLPEPEIGNTDEVLNALLGVTE